MPEPTPVPDAAEVLAERALGYVVIEGAYEQARPSEVHLSLASAQSGLPAGFHWERSSDTVWWPVADGDTSNMRFVNPRKPDWHIEVVPLAGDAPASPDASLSPAPGERLEHADAVEIANAVRLIIGRECWSFADLVAAVENARLSASPAPLPDEPLMPFVARCATHSGPEGCPPGCRNPELPYHRPEDEEPT